MTLSVNQLCLREDLYPLGIFSSAGKEPGVFDIVIVNDDLEEAYEKLKSVLIEVKLFHPCKKIVDMHHFINFINKNELFFSNRKFRRCKMPRNRKG